MWLLANRPPPDISLLLAGATDDSQTVPGLKAFAAAARPPTSVDMLVTPGGGHNWETWDSQLPVTLRWVGQRWHALLVADRALRHRRDRQHLGPTIEAAPQNPAEPARRAPVVHRAAER